MLNPSTKSKTVTSALVGAASLAAAFITIPAYAAGGGGGNTTVTPSCKKSLVWDRRKRKCVKARKRSGLDDDNLFAAARDLAYHGRYDEAINVLHLVEDKKAPRVLNYLGYSTRKLGRVEEGLTYYRAALKADPDYTLVREYMGEAFLQLGQVDKAKEQLAEIKNRCGADCREYALLDAEINKYLKK